MVINNFHLVIKLHDEHANVATSMENKHVDLYVRNQPPIGTIDVRPAGSWKCPCSFRRLRGGSAA
jgi:hypothetical protein